jgi:glycosyl transferase family 1
VPDGPLVVPNSVDLGFWRPDGPERLPGTGLHVVVVGRLAARKRPLDAVRALHDARRRIPGTIPLTATLVGDGPEHDRVARFLALHGMRPWVRLAGNLRPPAVRDVLADADVFLAPATLESFGIAALEARAAGLPVVARAGTGVADFVRDEQEGLLAADRGGLADSLVRLACEPALRAAITTHNRQTRPIGVDLPTVVARYEACYLQAGDLVRRRRSDPLRCPVPRGPDRARENPQHDLEEVRDQPEQQDGRRGRRGGSAECDEHPRRPRLAEPDAVRGEHDDGQHAAHREGGQRHG